MLALEIFVNGRRVALAGAENLTVLNAIVNAVGKVGRKTSGTKLHGKAYDLWLSVGGLTGRIDGTPDEHVRWVGHRKLKIGDRVEIRVHKVCDADSPIKSTPAARETQGRLQYKLARSRHLKLIQEYEKPRGNNVGKRTR